MASLNCDICVKTDNHCCKADIPLDIPIALALVEISGLTNLAITETPKFPGSVVIVDKNWFTDPSVQVDIQTKTCVFLKEGKCSVYDHRPDICRWYGTKQIRCRWEFIEPSKIAKATLEDVNYYDKIAMENSSICKGLV